ncbi:acyltransferase [Janibacter hoylei PVAS-1]|uniref:Acyltransferase n=2 Tax=Janibacter TaxID=53457 RepID=K1EN57_9MICO|nr:acyltransferase [Janibacter hoylei PVAS-1]
MDGAKARPGRILGLDALRAVAAWLVLLSHVAFWTGAGAEGIIGGLAVRGELGVAIFFALSAYLLSTPFVRRALGGHVEWSLPRYLVRRAARILPGYLLALAFVVAVAALLGGAAASALDVPTVLAHLVIGQGLTGETFQAFTQTWSLTSEVTFYLLLPLAALVAAPLVRGVQAAPSARRLLGLCAVVALVGIGQQGVAALVPDARWGGLLATSAAGHAAWFAVGVAVAVLVESERAGCRPRSPLVEVLRTSPGTAGPARPRALGGGVHPRGRTTWPGGHDRVRGRRRRGPLRTRRRVPAPGGHLARSDGVARRLPRRGGAALGRGHLLCRLPVARPCAPGRLRGPRPAALLRPLCLGAAARHGRQRGSGSPVVDAAGASGPRSGTPDHGRTRAAASTPSVSAPRSWEACAPADCRSATPRTVSATPAPTSTTETTRARPRTGTSAPTAPARRPPPPRRAARRRHRRRPRAPGPPRPARRTRSRSRPTRAGPPRAPARPPTPRVAPRRCHDDAAAARRTPRGAGKPRVRRPPPARPGAARWARSRPRPGSRPPRGGRSPAASRRPSPARAHDRPGRWRASRRWPPDAARAPTRPPPRRRASTTPCARAARRPCERVLPRSGSTRPG